MSRRILQSWAARLGGKVIGNSVRAPGPGHSANDDSLSVRVSVGSPNGFLTYSFADDSQIACLNYVRAKLGIAPFSPQRAAKITKATPEPAQDDRQAGEKRALALRLWQSAPDSRGTLVETYLKSRRLELPAEAAIEAIRFLASCPFGSERLHAMVCLIRDIRTNNPQGIHRTTLMPDGSAIKRNGKTFPVAWLDSGRRHQARSRRRRNARDLHRRGC